MDPALLLAPAAGLLGWQALRAAREGRRRRAARAGYLDRCRALLVDPRLRVEPDGLPRLAGLWRGARVDLRAAPDALAVRKLPTLWLLATLTEAQPVAATHHLMLRPRGHEPFSRFRDLPLAAPPLPGLPPDHGLRADAPGPAPAAIARPLDRLGEALKEVVVSPKGLRITVLAEEAHRGRYLLFRDAEMGREPLDPDRLVPVLDALLDLRDALR